MTAIFLIIWFYVYAGLMFGTVSNAVGLFPSINVWVQVLMWVFLAIVYLFKPKH